MRSATNILDTGRRWGDRPFLVGCNGETVLSYASLLDHAARYAAVLRDHGVTAGSTVLVTGCAVPDFVVAAFALLAIRAVLVPVDVERLGDSLSAVVENSNARHLISPTRPPLACLSSMSHLSPPGSHSPTGPCIDFAPLEDNDLVVVLYTSGTTGTPKGVALAAGSVIRNFRTYGHTLAFGPRTRILQVMPVHHADGWNFTLLFPFVHGCSVVCTPPFDATTAVTIPRILRVARPNVLIATPSILQALYRLRHRFMPPTVNPIQIAVTSSEPLPAIVKENSESLFDAAVCDLYGLTETQIVTYVDPSMIWSEGMVGRFQSGVEGRISSDGELQVRSPYLFAGYYGDDSATTQAYDGGWFRTGDLAEIDDAGMVRLRGRLKDELNRRGMKIAPATIDRALELLPGVRRSITLARPRCDMSDEIVAFVERNEPGPNGACADVLRQALRALGPEICPDLIFAVSEFPTNTVGKIDRKRLWRLATT